MKLNHKVNFGWSPPSEAVDDRYQRELDETLRKAERAWRKARQTAERAQRVAERKGSPESLRIRNEAIAELERRERELDEIRRLMSVSTYRQRGVVHRSGREERLEVGIECKPKRKRQPKASPAQNRRKS